MSTANRPAAASRLRRAAAAIRLALCQLYHIQFDAPWEDPPLGRC